MSGTKGIQGYREIPEEEKALINSVKSMETDVAAMVRYVQMRVEAELGLTRNTLHAQPVYPPNPDEQVVIREAQRQLALARTHFEDGFMHLVRAVARPTSPWPLPPLPVLPVPLRRNEPVQESLDSKGESES